jgi:hypothetical protein
MQAWKLFSEGGVEALEQKWEIIKSVTKKRIAEKKRERTERVVSMRPSVEDIPRPVRPRDMQGFFFKFKFNFQFTFDS